MKSAAPLKSGSVGGQSEAESLKLLIGDLEQGHDDRGLICLTLGSIQPHLEDWLDAHPEAAWIGDAVNSIVESLPQCESGKGRLEAKPGYMTEKPILAAMASQPHLGVVPEVVRNLQAALLLLTACKEEDVLENGYLSPLQRAGRAVREIAKHGIDDMLGKELSEVRSLPDLESLVLKWLEEPEMPNSGLPRLPRESLAKGDIRRLELFRVLLVDVVENRALRYRQSGAQNTTRKTRLHVDDPSRVPDKAIIDTQLDEQTRENLRKEGLAPVVEGTSEQLFAAPQSSRNDKYPPQRQTEKQANIRNILRSRAFKAGQQWVPNSTQVLHPPALAALFETDSNWDQKDQLRWEMLQLMLISGAEVPDLLECQAWSTLAEVPEDPEILGIIADTGTLVLPSLAVPDGWQPLKAFPRHFKKSSRTPSDYYRVPARQILLPIPPNLPAAQRLKDRAKSKSGQRLYQGLKSTDLEATAEALETHLSKLNDAHQTELTLHRISMHVANAIYALDGDLAEALMLSYRHRHASEERLYYYAPRLRHLVRQFARIFDDPSSRTPEQPIPDSSPPEDIFVGSEAVALTDRLAETVEQMVSLVEAELSGRGRRSSEAWRNAHNTFTAYVIRQIQWMTGIRAICDPIEIENYDDTTGFLRINDKDSNDLYAARVVWLLPDLQRQIRIYCQHCARASEALGVDLARLTFRFVQSDNSCPEVANSDLVKNLRVKYPYADNAHRHYFRTRLRELGIDAGYVDAWLGHGGTGREPYARHSTMTPARLRKDLEPALRIIWEELGWVILPRRK